MDKTNVGRWLAGLGFGQYAEIFAKNAIGSDVLSDLSEADLERLGIPLGDRKRLLKAIAQVGIAAVSGGFPGQAERRQLTVMFTDLVGSTALSSRLDPEDMREVIGGYHRWVAEIVSEFGGFVAKHMGDGVLIYFGYPQAHEDDPERAIRAGLQLIQTISRIGSPTAKMLQVRIGIGSGPVVVGDLVGRGEAQERGVVGETPNLAARLQAIAEPDTIVIAASTRRLAGELFQYRDLGGVAIKGFADAVPAWQVLRESQVESRFEAFHSSLLSPLVGREEEIELLLRRWALAKKSEGQVVLLSGEPGIGKSRIAAAVLERLGSDPHTRLRYFCSAHHQTSALHPFIRQLEHNAQLDRERSSEENLAKLSAVLASPSSSDLLLFGELLGLCSATEPLTPQKRRDKFFDAVVRHLEALTRDSPVLILFEDVHWCDPTSLELLSLIIERAVDLSALVIVSFRPEFEPPWVGQAHVSALPLRRLGSRLSLDLIAGITDRRELPSEVSERIISHSDGVPLFIEELTKTVLETGQLRLVDGRYVLAGPLPQLVIPSTLHASLLARLDRQPQAKEVAQVAAAIGREFSYSLLAAVTQIPETTLAEELRELVAAELVFQRGTPPDSSYTFKHALIQDAAYDTLLRSKRREIHGSVGQALARQFPELAETQPEVLAHHFAQAGLAAEAIDYWSKAGARAVNQSANREAVAHFQEALNLLSDLPDGPGRSECELHLLMALGPALVSTRPTAAPEVASAYERARELAHRFGRSQELFPAVWGTWMFAYNKGDFSNARRLTNELFSIARTEHNPDFLLQAHHAVWPLDMAEAEFSSARHHIEAGLAIYDPSIHGQHALMYGGHDPGVCGYTLDAQILAMLGYLDQAVAKSDRALTLARELSHPPSLIQALAFAADVHVLRRDEGKVEEIADALLPVALEYGTQVSAANAQMLKGWALCARGVVVRGISELHAGLAAWSATGSNFHKPYRLGRAAEILALAGQRDDASQLMIQAIAAVKEVGEHWYEGDLSRLRGEIFRGGPDDFGNEACFYSALRFAQKQKTRLFELRAARSLARLWCEQGRHSQARELLVPIYGWFTEGLDTPDLVEASELISSSFQT